MVPPLCFFIDFIICIFVCQVPLQIRFVIDTQPLHRQTIKDRQTAVFYTDQVLLLRDGSDRAGIGACAALNAGIGIDNALAVILADRFHRASAFASTAAEALIFVDFVCHCMYTSVDWLR